MSRHSSFLANYYDSFCVKNIDQMNFFAFNLELYNIDTLLKIFIIIYSGINEVSSTNMLIAISLINFIPLILFRKFLNWLLVFLNFVLPIFVLFFTDSFNKEFYSKEFYLKEETKTVLTNVTNFKQTQVKITSRSTGGFEYKIERDFLNNMSVPHYKEDWDLYSEVGNWSLQMKDIASEYHINSFNIYLPNNEITKYSVDYDDFFMKLNLNRFEKQCNISSEDYSVCFSQSGTKITKNKPFLVKNWYFENLGEFAKNISDSKFYNNFFTEFEYGKIVSMSIRLPIYNFSYLSLRNHTETKIRNSLINKTSSVNMFLINDVNNFLEEEIIHSSFNEILVEKRYKQIPKYFRALNPDYLEWSVLSLLGLILLIKNLSRLNYEVIKDIIWTVFSFGKYCVVLFFINNNFNNLGKYILVIIPELIIITSGIRQIGRDFKMQFRRKIIKKGFIEGDCVTSTVLFCLQTGIKTVTVKRIGDKYHIKPRGKICLNKFLSFYFIGFDLNKSKVTLNDKLEYFFNFKKFKKLNFYSSLIWSLFERQAYTKDFKTFEKVLFSYNPKITQFKINLKLNSVNCSIDTAKRIIYFVFYNTNLNVPNWGDYYPSRVQVSFYKVLKSENELDLKREYISDGKKGERFEYLNNQTTNVLICEIEDPAPKVGLIKKTERKMHPLKKFTNSDFFRRDIKSSTKLRYVKEDLKKKEVKPSRKSKSITRIKICNSCWLDLKIDIKNSLEKLDVLKCDGHDKYCHSTFNKVKNIPPKKQTCLRPKVFSEVNLNRSVLDRIFLNKALNPKTLHRKIKEINKNKFDYFQRNPTINIKPVETFITYKRTISKSDFLKKKIINGKIKVSLIKTLMNQMSKLKYMKICLDKTDYYIVKDNKLVIDEDSFDKNSSFLKKFEALIEYDLN